MVKLVTHDNNDPPTLPLLLTNDPPVHPYITNELITNEYNIIYMSVIKIWMAIYENVDYNFIWIDDFHEDLNKSKVLAKSSGI